MTPEREAFEDWAKRHWADADPGNRSFAIWQAALAWKAEQAQPELTNAEIEEIVSSMNSRLTGFQGWGWLDVARAVLKAQKEKT